MNISKLLFSSKNQKTLYYGFSIWNHFRSFLQEQQQQHHHHQLSKKRILNQLQSEVRALKETFLRAADIVEQMGHAMDTLDSVENDHPLNGSFLWENSSGRTRRNTHYQPKMNSNSEEAYLVRTLAEKMKTLPMQKVREIRSGKNKV